MTDFTIWDIALLDEWTKDNIPSPKGCKRGSDRISIITRPGKGCGKFESHKKPNSELMVGFDLPTNSFPP